MEKEVQIPRKKLMGIPDRSMLNIREEYKFGNIQYTIEVPITAEFLYDYEAYAGEPKEEVIEFLQNEVEKAFDEVLNRMKKNGL